MSDTPNAVAKQRPTLIIGLGGTGKQVLLNQRRMFYERYGVATPPHVAHLWIDTDTRNTLLDGKEMDFLMKEVDFKESEKVSTELKPSDLQNIYEHPDAHPHIFSWFDQRLCRHGHIPDGAGGIRSFGRLAFFRYYEDIMQRLRDTRKELERAIFHNRSQDELGISVDASETDMWMVFSVAGGTGSGMFLDLAFAIRDAWADIRTRSIIVLPSVFSNNTRERVYGNAYAALMELEHYTYAKDAGPGGQPGKLHRFPLTWTRELYLNHKRTLPGPVFDMSYLIGNRSASGQGALALEDKDSLCRMIAESLYIETATGEGVDSLAAERRSSQVNFSSTLSRTVPYDYRDKSYSLNFRDQFSCRYSSFGLSKIYIPLSRVEVVVHHRLARDLLAFWSNPQPIPADLDDLLERSILDRVGVDNAGKNRNFILALDSTGDGNRLVNRLRELLWSESRNRIMGMAADQGVRNAIVSWTDEILTTQLDHNHPNEERWGAMAKSIHQNAETHYRKVADSLNEVVSESLAQPGHRFDVAREILRRTRDRLLRDKERFEKSQTSNRNAATRAMKDAQERLQWLGDLKGSYTRRVVIEVVLEELEERLVKELQAQVLGAAAQLAGRLSDYIGRGQTEKNADGEEVIIETGLIKRLADFQEQLQNTLVPRVEKRLEALSKPQPSPIYQDMGEGSKEIERFYVDRQGNPLVESNLADLEQRFFETQAPVGPNSLWELNHTLSEEGADHLIKRLLKFSRSSMAHLQRRKVDVLSRLGEHHKPGSPEYERVVENLIGYARPWLSKPNHFVDGNESSPKIGSAMWISLHEAARAPEREAFQQTLQNKLSEKYQLVGGSADRIYAYSEMAGFPLMIIPDMDKYRNDSYYPLLEEGEVLHTDVAFEKFQDLLIMEPAEVHDYLGALMVFLRALSLGVIVTSQEEMKEEGEVLTFEYRYQDDLFAKQERLGPFSVAVRRLARDSERPLLDRIQRAAALIDGALLDDTRTRWYALLAFHADSPDSYFHQFPEDHVIRAVFRAEAARVKQTVPHAVDTAEVELANITHWSKERPTDSGLRYLQTD